MKPTKKSKLNPNARKWVKALRSGKYRQCKGKLTRIDRKGQTSHCCLGVACEVFIKSGGKLRTCDEYSVRSYGPNNEADLLPGKVKRWLGLNSTDGSSKMNMPLSKLNDNGKRFKSIADIIESQPEGLFA